MTTPAIHSLAIIGGGPTCLYLLKHLADHADALTPGFRTVRVYEAGPHVGEGMPYSPAHTDRHHLCNISSEEIPPLNQPLADWLADQPADLLTSLGCDTHHDINESELYSRLIIGRYLRAQFQSIASALQGKGIHLEALTHRRVVDVVDQPDQHRVMVVAEDVMRPGQTSNALFGRVVICTGHRWPTRDRPDAGYYASPWPIHKLLPADDGHMPFDVGLLGASLSAFDVAATLAHRHGTFHGQGPTTYTPHPGSEGFRLVMHALHGQLPHLQYEQREPFRALYRHVDQDTLQKLRDPQGFLRLDDYFQHVARPALQTALQRDGRADLVTMLDNPDTTLEDFVQVMSDEHDHADPFKGMRAEMPEARHSLHYAQPIHWKEVFDDLMYTLNFHAHWLCAEDHLRWRRNIMPFLLNVIAAMPLRSARMLLALRAAGKLELVPGNVTVEPHPGQTTPGHTRIHIEHAGQTRHRDYRCFIDCTGQPGIDLDEYPFPSLVQQRAVRPARAAFASPIDEASLDDTTRSRIRHGHDAAPASLLLGGIDLTPDYRVIADDGTPNPRIHDAAFPHATGLRPYSFGLQACDQTARCIIDAWRSNLTQSREHPEQEKQPPPKRQGAKTTHA